MPITRSYNKIVVICFKIAKICMWVIPVFILKYLFNIFFCSKRPRPLRHVEYKNVHAEVTGFRELVYGRHYFLLQMCRFLVALLLNHWAALSGGLWLLSACHKVITEDVTWLGTCWDSKLDSNWHIFTTVSMEDICSVGRLSAAEYEGIFPWYRLGYLCYTILARRKGTIVLYSVWKRIPEKMK